MSEARDSIFASIDGATQEAYEKYRVGGNLARALRNLRQLSEAKTRCHSRTPALAWAYCVHRFNEAEIDQAKALAAEMDVPIFFRLLSTHEETWRSWYHDHPDHPVLATPGWWTDVYPTAPAPDLAGIEWNPALPGVCKQPFSTMIVDWNGEVTPCCAVFGQHYRLGNLLEQDLEAVWNGEPLRNCRNFLLNYGKVRGTGSVCETLPCLVNV
jgi:radical SAM protein with 4Fe4S-binding SPASM domain